MLKIGSADIAEQ